MAGTENIKELKEQLELIKKLIKAEGDLAKKRELTARQSSLEKVIRNLDNYEDSLDNAARRQQDIIDGANSMGQALANLPLGNYLKFATVTEDISKKIAVVEENMAKVSSEINKDFAKIRIAAPDSKNFKKGIGDIAADLNAKSAGMGDALRDALTSGDISSFFKKYGDEGRKAAKEALDGKKGFIGAAKYFGKEGQGPKDLKTFQDGIKQIEAEAKTFQQITLDTSKLWRGIRDNILQNFGFGRILTQLKQFDNQLADVKREFQIPKSGFKGASEAMADLTVKGAKFGLSTQESFAMFKSIGDEMRSTNVKNIAAITQSVAAVPAAMGIASTEVAKITGQMMFFGQYSDKVSSAFKNISRQSSVFGVNATKVAKQFGDAYPKFKMMGMKGTEGAIAAMAAQAEKLGINLESSVQSSKNFLDIGEAMESAADLSLLGGAAAQVSFADLMQARLDPKKMIDIQNQITAGFGKFNKATGEVEFGYSELVQMQEQAKRLGVEYEVLYKRAKGNREEAVKASQFDSSMFKGLKPEEKQFLLSKVISKGGGKFGVEGFEGIKDLKNLSSSQVRSLMSKTIQDKKSMEDLAKERASFEDTVNRMKGTIMALFNRFQPILQMLTNVLGKVIDIAQKFSNAITSVFGPTAGKYIKATMALAAVLLLTMGPTAIAKFAGILTRGFSSPMTALKGFGARMGTAFKGGGAKKLAETVGGKAGGGDIGFSGKMPKKGPTFLQQFAKISPKQILSVAAAMIALGVAFLLIGKGIKLAATGLATFVKSFKGLNPAQLSAVKGALLGFGIGIAVLLGVLAALAYSGIGLAGIGIMLGFGAAALMIGGAVFLAAKGLSHLALAVTRLGKSFGGMIKGIKGLIMLAGALVYISPALLIFGVASLVAVPGMLALGYLVKALAGTKGINAGLVKNLGSAMGSMAWGLIKLSLAAVFAPFAILAAKALSYVVKALGSIGNFDSKKAVQFGNSLNTFAGATLKGMKKLGLMGVYAIPALLAAYSISKISKLLNAVQPVNEKNIKSFANSLGVIGQKVFWGLAKLTAIAVVAIGARSGASAMNSVSALLNGIKPVDSKNLSAFVKSLGKVGLLTFSGMTKLALVGIVAIPAQFGAKKMATISYLLNNIKPVDDKKLSAFGKSLGKIGLSTVSGMVKLATISMVVAPAQFAAKRMATISSLLNNVKPVDAKNLSAFGKSLGNIGLRMAWGLAKLAAITVVAVPAMTGAKAISSISTTLNGLKPVNPVTISMFTKSLSAINAKFTKSIDTLGSLALRAIFASFAAKQILSISKSFASIVPINLANMMAFSKAMSFISGRMAWGVTKLGLLLLPLALANKSALYMSSISRLLSGLKPIPIVSMMLFGTAMGLISGRVISGIIKLGLIYAPLALANKSAGILLGISKQLAQVKAPNIAAIASFGTAMGLVSGRVISGVIKLGLIYSPLALANKSAGKLLGISKQLAQVKAPNIAAIASFGTAMGLVSGRVIWGVVKLGLIYSALALANKSASLLASISKSLSLVKAPNIPAMAMFGNSLSIISGKVIYGISQLGKIHPSLLLANKSARLLMTTSRYLRMVVPPNVSAMAIFGNSLSIISGKVMWGITKLGFIYGPLALANKSASLLVSISRSLSLVKAPNISAMAMFGASLGTISDKTIYGIRQLGNIHPSLLLAKKSASLLMATSMYLRMVKAPNILAMMMFGKAVGTISGKVMQSVNNLAKLRAPLATANVSARLMVALSRVLISASASLQQMASTINKIPFVRTAGLKSLRRALGEMGLGFIISITKFAAIKGPATNATDAARSLAKVSLFMNMISPVNEKRAVNLAKSITSVTAPLLKSLALFGSLKSAAVNSQLTASSLVFVSSLLNKIQTVQKKPFLSLATVLTFVGPKVKRGIQVLGTVAPFAPLGIITASSLIRIAGLLNKIPIVTKAPLVKLTAVLAEAGLRMLVNMTKFIFVSSMAVLAIPGALALRKLARTLAAIPVTNTLPLLSLNKTLGVVGSRMAFNLSKFSVITSIALAAIPGARALNIIARNLATIPMTSAKPLVALGNMLGSMGKKLKDGLFRLASLAGIGPVARMAAINLAVITRELSRAVGPNTKALVGLGYGLLAIVNSIPGIIKLSTLRAVSVSAAASAKQIVQIARSLSAMPTVNVKALSALSFALGSNIQRIVNGIRRLTQAVPFIPNAKISASGISAIANLLAKVPLSGYLGLANLSRVLTGSVRRISPGMTVLSKMVGNMPTATGSARGIFFVANFLKMVPLSNYLGLTNLSKTLFGSALRIMPGMMLLSKMVPYVPGGVASAKGLSLIGNYLRAVSVSTFLGLSNLSKTLYGSITRLTPGLVAMSRVTPFVPGAVSGAKAISAVANSLKTISAANYMGLANLSRILYSSVLRLKHGISLLSKTMPYVPNATVSAKGIAVIGNALKQVPVSAYAGVSNLSRVLFGSALRLIPGIALLSKIAGSVSGAVVSARGIALIANSLKQVQISNYLGLTNLSKALLSVAGKLGLGVSSLSKITVFASAATVSSKGIMEIAKFVKQVPQVPSIGVSSLGNALSRHAGKLIVGITLLSRLVPLIGSARTVAAGLVPISNDIKKVPQISFMRLLSLGMVLSMAMGSVSKGIRPLSQIAPFISGAIVSAAGLASVGNNIKKVPQVFSKGMDSLGKVLSTQMQSVLTGIRLLSRVAPFTPSAATSAAGLVVVANNVRKISFVPYDRMSSLGKALGTQMPNLTRGVILLSRTATYVPNAIIGAQGLLKVAQAVKQLPIVFLFGLSSLGKALASKVPNVLKGVILLSRTAPFTPSATVAAQGILKIAKAAMQIPQVSLDGLSSVGRALGSQMSNVSRGVMLLARTMPFNSRATVAAQGLLKVALALKQVPQVALDGLSSLGRALSTQISNVSRGIALLARTMPFVPNATVAAQGLLKVALAVRQIPWVLPIGLNMLGRALSGQGPNILRGVISLARTIPYITNATAAAQGLLKIALAVKQVPQVSSIGLSSLGRTLSSQAPKIYSGIVLLARTTPLISSANAAAQGLLKIATAIKQIPIIILSTGLTTLGRTLSSAMPGLNRGVALLSRTAPFTTSAVLAAQGLLKIALAIKQIPQAVSTGLSSLGKTLSKQMPNVMRGVVLLARTAPFVSNSIAAAQGLLKIATAIKQIPIIILSTGLTSLGRTLSSAMPGLNRGVALLARTAPFITSATSAAQGLLKIALAIKQIPQVSTVGMSSLGRTLSSQMPNIFRGIINLVRITPLVTNAIAAAQGLLKIASAIKQIPQILAIGLSSMGRSLSSNMQNILKGVTKLARTAPFISNAVVAAQGLLKVAQAVTRIPQVLTVGMSSLGRVLSGQTPNIFKGISLLAKTAPFTSSATLSAQALLKVALAIKQIPQIFSVGLSSLGNTLSKNMQNVFKGVKLLAKTIPLISGAVASAQGLLNVANAIKQIPQVLSAGLLSVGRTLSKQMPGVFAGVKLLAQTVPFISGANTVAYGLLKISQSLRQIPQISYLGLSNLGRTLSRLMTGIINGVSTLSRIAQFAPNAVVGVQGLAKIASALKSIPFVFITGLPSLKSVLAKHVVSLSKGVSALSRINTYVPNAVAAAQGLLKIANALKQLPQITSTGLSTLGRTLSWQTPNLFKGLKNLALIAPLISNASSAAQGLLRIAIAIKQVPQVVSTGLTSLGRTLSGSMPNAYKGLLLLAKTVSYIANANTGAQGLLKIGSSLKQIPQINLIGFLELGRILANQMPSVFKGVTLLSKISVLTSSASAAAQGLLRISSAVNKVPQIFFAGLFSLGRVLASQMPNVMKGTSILSRIMPFVPSATVAAQGLLKVALAVKRVPQVFFIGLLSLGRVLASQMPNVSRGVTQLSRIAPLITSATTASKGLAQIGLAIKQLPQVFFVGLMSLGRVLGSHMPNVFKGVTLLSRTNSFIPSAVTAAQGLLKVAIAVKQIPQVFFVGLFSLGRVVASQMPNVFRGVVLLSRTTPFIPSAIVAAQGMVKVANAVKQIPQVFFAGLSSIGHVLSINMSKVLRGVTLLARTAPFVANATSAASGLVQIASAIKKIPQVFFSLGLLTLGYVLSGQMPKVFRGVTSLARTAPFVANATSAASGLVQIANAIKKISEVSLLGLSRLGKGLSNQMPFVFGGTILLSRTSPYISGALSAAQGLLKVALAIRQIPQVFFIGLFSLGRVLGSQMPSVLRGVTSLARTAPFVANATSAAQGLKKTATAIREIPQVFFVGLLSLGRVLASQMPSVLRGVTSLARTAPFVANATSAAQGLKKTATAIREIPQVFFVGLLSLGRVLASQMPSVLRGVTSLARTAPFVANATSAAQGLKKTATAIREIPQVFFVGLLSLGRVLASQMPSVLRGVTSLARTAPFVANATSAAQGLKKTATAIREIPQVFFVGLLSLGRVLASQMPSVLRGVTSLARTAPFVANATSAAQGLKKTATAIREIPQVFFVGLLSLGRVLASQMPSVLRGVTLLARTAPFVANATSAAQGLKKTASAIKEIPQVSFVGLLSLGRVLASQMPNVLRGVTLLARTAPFVANATSAASGLVQIASAIKKIPQVFFSLGLLTLGYVLSGQMPKVFRGVTSLARTAPFVANATSAASGLVQIASAIKKISEVSLLGLSRLGKGLSNQMPFVFGGTILLSRTSPYISGALSAAQGLLKVALAIRQIPQVFFIGLFSLGRVLASQMSNVLRGVTSLARTAPFVANATSAAQGLKKTATAIREIPQVFFVGLLSLGRVLASQMPSVLRGVTSLARTAPFVANATSAAQGLKKTATAIREIPQVFFVGLLSLGRVLASQMPSVLRGVTSLARTAPFVANATSAAQGLKKTATAIREIPQVFFVGLLSLGRVLASQMPSVLRGVTSLARTAPFVANATSAAQGLKKTATAIREIPQVFFVGLLSLGRVLASQMPSVLRGVTLLARTAPFVANATSAAQGLKKTASAIKEIPQVSFVGLLSLGRVLASQMPNVLRGVTLLARTAPFVANATSAASGLVQIASAIKKIPQVFFSLGLLTLGYVLSGQMPKVFRGVTSLARTAPFVANATSAASGLVQIASAIKKISEVSLLGLSRLGKGLSNQMPFVFGGTILLSRTSPYISGALSAAQGLLKVALAIRQIPQVFFIGLFSLGRVLASQMSNVLRGVTSLARTAPFVANATSAAQGLKKTATAIREIPQVFFVGLLSLGRVLASQMPSVLRGVTSLARTAPFVANATSAAQGLKKTATAIREIPQVFFVGLLSLGRVLASQMPSVLRGVTSLARTAPFVANATSAAQGLKKTATAIREIPQVFFVGLLSLGRVLASQMPSVLRGVTSLARTAPFVANATSAAQGLKKTASAIKEIPQVSFVGLLSLGRVLASQMPSVLRGVTLLARTAPFVANATSAASGLVQIANAIKKIPQVFFSLGLLTLGYVLSGQMPKVFRGVTLLARTAPFVANATSAASGLVQIASAIKKISEVSLLGLSRLGKGLSNQMPFVFGGIILLSRTSPYISGALSAAQGLLKVALAIRQIPQVFFIGLFSLGRVLASQMPSVLRGISMLSMIGSLVSKSTASAQGLLKLSLAIRALPQVFFVGLFSLGRVLSSQMPRVRTGLDALARALGLMPLSVASAIGLKRVADSVRSIPQTFFLGLSSLGNVLSSQMPKVANGLRMLRFVQPLVSGATRTATRISRISRILNSIAFVNPAPVTGLGKLLSSITGVFTTAIFKWMSISMFIGPVVKSMSNIARIFVSLNSVKDLDSNKIMAILPILNQLAKPLLSFAKLGGQTPSMVNAATGLKTVGKALETASKGFIMFAKVPFATLMGASKSLSQVTGSLNAVASKTSVSPGLSNLSKTLFVLGYALRSVSVGFSASAKAMAEFSTQADRLKVSTAKSEIPAKVMAVKNLKERGPAATATKPVSIFNPATKGGGENIKIAPIEINLKLNGMQIQKLITEANFYRT